MVHDQQDAELALMGRNSLEEALKEFADEGSITNMGGWD